MKPGPGPIKPWYFKDGTPIRSDVIRRIVDAATKHAVKKSTEPLQLPPQPPEDLIRATARYFAQMMERHLVTMLLKEFNTLHRRPVFPSGDAKLDAVRKWRREYQRIYRLRKMTVN